MIEKIYDGSLLLSIIIRANYSNDGIKFFTPEDFSQQLGYMNRPAGYKISPHIHNEVKREVTLTNEVLFIRKGRIRVDFYCENLTYLESRVLLQGDIVLLANGAHGFEMLEPSEIVEVKQGPYAGENDKTIYKDLIPDRIMIKPQR